MFLLYNILLTLAFPIILAVLFAKKRCRLGLLQRLGWLPGEVVDTCRVGRTIWVHAVSLGEATAAVPLVQALRARYPSHRIIVSTVTETGKEVVVRRLDKQATHIYFPLDYPWVVRRVLDAVRPCAFIFIETEIWPNFLLAAAARGLPTILVNGRLSTDSFQGYLRLRPFFHLVLETLSLCLMQTDRDVERIVQLGALPERVSRTGNIKFDQHVGPRASESQTLTRTDLGLRPHEEMWVAGSTHPIEEEEVLDCYRRLLEGKSSLVLVMAPRHIERVDALEEIARARGFSVLRRTTLSRPDGATTTTPDGARVIILDTRGELAALYREAILVFVGGSLVPIGGHSPLEAAAWGKAVVFGPYMDHFAEVADSLIRKGGGIQVNDAQEMADALAGLLADRPRLDRMGKAALELVLANQGAVARNVELIAVVLGEG